MNTNTAKRIMFAGITAMAVTWFAGTAHALKAPHDYANQVTCNYAGASKGCHSKSVFWKGMTSINSGCINTTAGCHHSNTGALAKKKALSLSDASNRFGRIAQIPANSKQSSHGWKIPFKNSTSGRRAGVPSHQMLSEKNWYNSVNKTNITCTRCHRAMGDTLATGDKFLREPATGNYICFKCHSARRIDNVRDYNSSVASQTLHYSHPVEVNYSTARAAKPDFFNATFRLATGYDESARPRLYTTHASAQGGTKKGAVVCQSCHGPTHAADSNPYTFDSLSSYSRLGNYSSSAGNLLRTYPIAGPKASNNLCLSCHKVQTHQSFMCGRCHTPHKKAGENNRYLILENISTPSSGKRSVAFTSRSEMAARFAAGYSSTQARTVRQASNRICQVCHMNTRFHRNYSSPGGTVYRTHNMTDEGDPSKKYKFCPDCHKHTGGFTPSGCGTCHNFPPNDVIDSTASFKHAKHTNGNVEPVPSNTSWKTGMATDNRSDTSYGFSCARCHSPWAPYTAFGLSSDGYKGKNHYGDNVISQKVYTADVGFKIRTAINARPWNPLGSYLYATGGPIDSPGNGQWRGAGAGATCYNLYCHGNFYNGYTSNNPTATGTQACGKCHGASNTDPPGKTGGVNYGAHPRHVGSANSQQYGSGTPNFRCNACHSLTSKYNNETTVSSRKYHVNGIVNIKFDNGSSSSFRVGNGSSNYGGYNNYTSRRPAMSNPFSSSRPAYTTCRLIYCHSNGSRTQGNYSAPNNAGINPSSPWPNWSSSRNFTTTMSINGYSMKTRCARCHGNTTYKGITMAMPNYTSNDPSYSIKGPKENSHRKHVIENKFRCNVCHSSTINSANNAIVSTQNHVNKFYNISIIAAYRSNGVGRNYSSVVKTCKSITCHAGKATPAWGSKIGCANCHLSNIGDNDKRIKVSNAFQSFSESAPKIYSAQWAETGHGRSSATQYPSGSNYGANKTCTNCHSASVAHNTASNPFRLYTAAGRPNRVCEGCHGTNAWVSGGANRQGIQTHASSVVQPAKFNFAIKCIDCHDPHGDNNTRFMIHSTVARPLITGTRAESSNQYGQRQTNVTSSNVDFNQNLYSSDYARKYKASKICQVCHTRTVDRDNSSPTYLKGRFRWYSGSDKAHGSGKCTSCHSHGSGFKGAGCNGCHGFPPIGVYNVLSGAGRTLESSDNKQRPSGNSGSEAATAGAHQKHFGNFSNAYNSSKQTICSFCHQGGMYATGSLSLDIEIGFKAFTDYSGSTQKYTGQSAVRSGYYGYSGVGIDTGNDMKCTVKCHGGGNWLSNNLGNYSSPRWNVSNSVRCGKCHGVKKGSGVGSWPTSNRHQKHAGYPSGTGYDFMCRLCHADTVMGTATTLNKTNHVNGEATFRFYTGTDTGNRVWSGSAYNGGDTKVNSGFGRCENLYCHSRGTKTLQPYTGIAFPNYTAKWDASNLPASATEKCSYCHGSKKSAGGYAGITSAMPNQANQAHKKHVVDNGLKCSFCHAATVDSSNAIVSTTNHVNKFKNISIVATFRQGLTMYSSSLSSTNKTCKNVRCHAGKKTPNWTVAYGTINCSDCHYSNTSDTDDFAFRNFSGTAAQIYSTEWAKRGHGKSKTSGKYPFSNNTGAQKNCTNCHKPAVKHGDANYFRLYTSNSDSLCMSCHGRGNQLNAWSQGYSDITGIQSHTWNNISSNGYNGGTNGKAATNGGWNFGTHDGTDSKRVKCVDCHDPHGDKNNYMVHSYINMSGSDRVGRPTAAWPMDTNLMNFTAVGGPQVNWSSYVRSDFKGICQRCHSNMGSMINFNKGTYSNHNRGKRCTDCHKHRKGFAPAGCDSCHDYPPPKAPTTLGWNTYADDMSNMSSLHQPHAWNKRLRPGIPTENDVNSAGGKPDNERGYFCYRCHGGAIGGNGQSSDHGTGYPAKQNASMQNLTMLNGAVRTGKWSPGALAGGESVTDDTCWNVACHTPRYYARQWKKPTGCGDCHGYRNKTETAAQAFKIQTTGSHKIHVNYSTPGIAGTDFKKYGLRCSNCHYDWQGLNNYSTHYSNYVNMTANGPINTIANMKVKDGQFYTKGRSFKGYTTGNESFGTCAKAYCHGNFTNGTTATMPNWKKGVSPVTCTSCHKGKLNEASMPERHPKHVQTYGFACVRCHVRTTNNITTIIFNYSSHVNGRKDVYFNNQGGIDNTVGSFNPVVSSRQCSNTYCHSKGYRSTGSSFTTRTTLANYTADWDVTAEGRAGTNKGCSFCHGNKIYNGITAAMPNQTSLWGNSHRTHVIKNNFRCVNCHAATVNSAGTINYAGGRHVDGFKTITIIGAYKSGATSYGAGKTCANVKCHAGKTTPQWGTYARCQDCHLSNTGDTDKRISANNTFQYYTAKTGATAPRIYSTAWRNVGHGRQSAYSSGNLAANKTCTNCHKASVAHGTASNPFRLYTINSVSGNPNTLCNDCHGTNPGTPANKVGILTHASSVTQTGRHNFAIKCIDCHDPHGDNNRRFMVHSSVPRPRLTGTRAEISNANGSIFLNATGRNVDFNQNLYSSDYAKKTQANKICQVCHTRTFKPNSSMTRFRWNGSNDNSHGTGKCINCHSHSQGFKGAACNSCHGFPPASANTLIGRPGTNQAKTMSSSTTAGAHLKHVDVYGSSNDTCNKCHSGGMAFDSNEDDDITLKFDAFSRYTGVNQKYHGQSAVRTGFYGYSGVGAGTGSNQTCSSMKCHGAKGSWLTKSFGTPSAPVWNQAGSVFCGSCHGAKKAAGQGSWPTTKGHAKHVGTGADQYDFQCRLCHSATVATANYTTLNDSTHVNAESVVELYTGVNEKRTPGGSYDGSVSVNSGFGKCSDTYCHSRGNRKTGWVGQGDAAPNYLANWTAVRGGYKKANSTLAKCNFCHGNTMSGVTAAMPDYTDGTPKANKHSKHVKGYGFTCTACHVNVTRNNSSIDAPGGAGLNGLHVNRAYNVNFTSVVRSGNNINNSQGRYTSTNSGCRSTYCHSKGSDFASYVIPNYTAHWNDNRGGYKQPKANMAKCNYCHGNRNTYSGMTSAMPNYANLSPKANRHPMHVAQYGFSCTVCHDRVTANSTSIDASSGSNLHVNKSYNVDFNKTVPGRFSNNTGAYTYVSTGQGSRCKNTYCHSRGTDRVPPYITRTSLSNYTAQWGDTRGSGSYKQAAGQKAKCNYCHGNRLFSGITSAMPNYTSAATTNTAKWNTHPIHVRSYGFTCSICHVKVAANNTSISGSSLHVNQAYDVNFKANVRGNLTNNTGVYSYIDLVTKNRCKNTYCHSRGTDFTKPYGTRTSLSNFTAMWGDSRPGYKQAKGVKAKCNYCHGNRAYSGTTSAMPNYSGNYNGTPAGVTAKANSHRKHVVENGFVCSTCHYGVVRNNTSISDRTNHVNGFYNISITPAKKSAAGKAYSTNWTNRNAGGTCMRNACHGTSTPQWGNPSTANCKACHLSSADNDQYAVVNDTPAGIYSSEWRKKGHGKFDAFTSKSINRCERCHSAGVAHNYAQGGTPYNPFRLYTSQSDALCANCHGTPSERNKTQWGGVGNFVVNQYTGILTHSKANTSGNAQWNTHSSVTGKGAKCVDCHDPHGDKNKKMVHAYINHSGSDRFGRPAGKPWNTLDTNAKTQMTFTSHAGYGGQVGWSSFVNNNPDRSICRRCHSPGDTGLAVNMTKDNYAVTHQNHSEKCTVKCHMHKTGFKPTGESQGNEDCSGCHGTGDLLEKMQATNNYHHVMTNTSATGNPKYPTVSSFGPTAQKNPARRCLMCHVDHNIFRPDINTDGTGGRARNLRWSVFDKGNTGINTDFWPAKRKNATGRTGADSGTGNYSSTRPISGPSTFNGVCISCHKNVQYKNTTLVNDDIQVQRARSFSVSLYTSSSHNFQVISATFVYGTGSSKSRFRGNCTKCHRTPDNDFSKLSKSGAQSGKWPVALHDKNVPSLLMNIATSSSKPMIEQLCYNCHDTLARTSSGPGSMDFYSSVKMNSGAKMIKTAITGKRYVKPVEDEAMAGMHKADEYFRASTSVTENSNPTVLWNYSTGAAGGVGRHIECVDCHNTHGGNASIRRLTGAPFRGKLNTQQAAYFNYTRDTGNMIAGAQKGVWGVSISYSNGVAYRGQTPKFKKIAQVTYQYEVCLKCHSRYAYGNNPPGVPDGLPDPAGTTVAPFDNLNPSVPQADISKMINPNNYGYHPIYRKGRNQPPKSGNTDQWPAAKSNWMYKDRFNNKTAFISVSGLSWAFVPPFSQHSLLACTDCHVADNSGKALGKYVPGAAPTTGGTWSNATQANIEKSGDGLFARGTTASATIEVSVTCPTTPGPNPDANGLNVVLYARTNNTGSNNQRTTTLDALKSAVIQGATGTVLIAKGTTTAFGRYERNVGTWTADTWANIENLYTVKLTTNGTAQNLDVDYMGIEVQYTTTADVRGPHGSMERWLLTDIDEDIWFDADNSNTLTYAATDRPNDTTYNPLAAAGDSRVFCWNCHRRDVYTDAPVYQYSRLDHTSGGGQPFDSVAHPNQWGIVCMNCHAGGGIGEIHGSFANSTTPNGGADDGGVNWGAGGGVNLQRPRGVRLLNGARYAYNPVTNTCYEGTTGASTPFASGTCNSGTNTPVTNYTYTSW